MRERERCRSRLSIIELIGVGDSRTDVPAVIGIAMSNTIIRAVNVVASGTIDVDGHSMLPTFK